MGIKTRWVKRDWVKRDWVKRDCKKRDWANRDAPNCFVRLIRMLHGVNLFDVTQSLTSPFSGLCLTYPF